MNDSSRNPLIGLIPADTLSNCAQALEIVQLASENNKRRESTYGDDKIAEIEQSLGTVKQETT